ncbi:MAG: hypothetical protein ABR604_04345 [Jatrophihabitantaceae bacterium]
MAAIGHLSTTRWVLLILVGLVVLAIVAALVGHELVRRGRREPLLVRLINRVSGKLIDAIRRPITIAVLDEVAEVLQAGHYTQNVAAALRENHEEIKRMFAEKIKQDPTARHIGLLPFHDRIINEASETTLRVLLEVLADPRTDELVSDLLRDNIIQIRMAVRARQDGIPVRALTATAYRGVGPSRSPSASR